MRQALIKDIQVVPVRDLLAGTALDGVGSLTQQVYVALRRLAVELRLLPNQFLSEKDVADGLRVSRTPVREAFIRLGEDGVVNVQPQSGTYVATIDFVQAEEGFFVWSALESSCAGRVAEKGSLRDIGVLRDLAANEREAAWKGDAAAFRRTNNVFHDAVFDLAEFPGAKKVTDSARFEVDRIRNMLQMYNLIGMDEVAAEHNDIVNAIASGDAAAAEELMEKHLGNLRTAMRTAAADDDFQRTLRFLNQKRTGKRKARAGRQGEPLAPLGKDD